MQVSRRRFAMLATAAGLPMSRSSAFAQGVRPLAVIVPFEAGSAPDTYARIIVEAMRKSAGRAIVVENKPGAAGNVAAQAIAREAATGDTIMVGTMALCEINPLVFNNLHWSMKDFTPVLKGIGSPLVLVVHKDVPARTLAELVAWAKSKPGSLNYASYSAGTPGHFLGAQFNAAFGLDLAHVPYRGSASQVTEILAGHSPLGFAQTQNALPHVQSGGLRAIAITSDERNPLLPDTPTFRELGHPAFSTSVWFGMLVRSGTPADALQKITAAVVAAHADPHVREVLIQQGYDILAQDGETFAKSIEAGTSRWAATVKATGFKAAE